MQVLIWVIVIGLLVGLVIAGTAYSKVNTIIEKYSHEDCKIGCTAGQLVEKCNEVFNLNVKLALTNKRLGNAYIVKKKIIVLDKDVVNSKSISAIAIASHEIGHAFQEKNGNFLLKLDMFFRKIYSILKFLIVPILISGVVLLFIDDMVKWGLVIIASLVIVWLFSLITRVITIPMEYGASNIAYNMLKENRVLTRAELKITKKILNAAALTYVGAVFVNLLNALKSLRGSFKR